MDFKNYLGYFVFILLSFIFCLVWLKSIIDQKNSNKKLLISKFLRKMQTLPDNMTDLDNVKFLKYLNKNEVLGYICDINVFLKQRTFKSYKFERNKTKYIVLVIGVPQGTHLIYLEVTGKKCSIDYFTRIDRSVCLSLEQLIKEIEIK